MHIGDYKFFILLFQIPFNIIKTVMALILKRFLTTYSRLLYCDSSASDNYYSMYKDTYTEHAKKLSHVDEKSGKAKMVDVGNKDITERTAKAKASVFVGNEVFELIKSNLVQAVISMPQWHPTFHVIFLKNVIG